MPATTVEEWLQSDDERSDGGADAPHRCKKIVREWTTDDDGAFVTCCADDGTQQTHRLVAMSSLSRRACYKCGNVGHYAEVCSSAERLCYNCKQPGHESNGCPLPRTTEAKQCYHCQGLGHVQADCPTLRLSGAGTSGRCYNCGQPGHLARSCPSPAGPGGPIPGAGRGVGAPRGGFAGGFAPRGGFAGGPRPATCYKCGGPNHFARDCQAQAMKCYACGKLGHISRDCTAPNGGPLNTAGKTCYQCGEAGHISRDCPQKATNGDLVADGVDLGVAPVAPVAPVA
ncbi:Zinc finger protein [Lachnellula suecica]|uniref:Zinc finger protein n=1 Tax=Lachnellula suecica TaxID=602035 RepID=A0A8T9BX73_9HELO|nr:Zinc finger protein [Lachnellula suecica]